MRYLNWIKWTIGGLIALVCVALVSVVIVEDLLRLATRNWIEILFLVGCFVGVYCVIFTVVDLVNGDLSLWKTKPLKQKNHEPWG